MARRPQEVRTGHYLHSVAAEMEAHPRRLSCTGAEGFCPSGGGAAGAEGVPAARPCQCSLSLILMPPLAKLGESSRNKEFLLTPHPQATRGCYTPPSALASGSPPVNCCWPGGVEAGQSSGSSFWRAHRRPTKGAKRPRPSPGLALLVGGAPVCPPQKEAQSRPGRGVTPLERCWPVRSGRKQTPRQQQVPTPQFGWITEKNQMRWS